MPPMRILYLHRTQGEEPESIHIAAIVDALRGLGHEVRIVGPAPLSHAPDGDSRPTLAGRIKRAAPRWAFELMQIGYNAVAWWRTRRVVREFRPDLIYERYALFAFVGVLLARARRIPLILEVNTPYAQAWAQYYGLNLRRLARWIEHRTLLAADHVITVTQVQREMLVGSGLPAARVSVCHNAIDPAWFDPDRHADPALRGRLGLSGIVVGFVGTMNRWQGIDAFGEVLRSVLTRRSDVNFLFVGDGEFRTGLEAFCRDNGFSGRVRFTGRKPHREVPPLVGVMDIAVLLDSNRHGSPMKIFEYLGMAKAVVAPGVPPVLEVMRDGVTGLVIEPGSAAQMADRILQLAADPALRSRLGGEGRAYVIAHHTWRENALHIVRQYGRLVGHAVAAG
jgi:glycosyltransferase involved in cell wall biosynthesis